MRKDDNFGTKTMAKAFTAESTKGNFLFLCDPCLTGFERNLVETEKQKVACLEQKVVGMENKLDKIMGILEKTENKQPQEVVNVWKDQQALKMIRASPQKNVLVIKANENDQRNINTRAHVEKSIMDHKIPVCQSFDNNNGDLVVVCESEVNRDHLKDLVATDHEEIEMTTSAPKRASITIVGLKRQYSSVEIMEMLVI